MPLYFDSSAFGDDEVEARAIEFIKSCGHLQTGDAIILTKGVIMGDRGNTNIMKILPVA
jgi:pyruvate kinase